MKSAIAKNILTKKARDIQAFPGFSSVIGKTISHYRVLQKLGQGGMGEVFLAEDLLLDRKVALKFLGESMQQDPIAHKRFVREAKAAAALDHPYICKIYETGESEGRPFIAMEYVQGQSLKERLATGPLSLEEMLHHGVEIAEALEEAHELKIVHRDLKPPNIFMTPQGHIKVMDFGLAKRLFPEAGVEGQEQTLTESLTQGGFTLGTLAYMSPEQLLGRVLDTRSDIFSLGSVLYEVVTGVHPFHKPSSMDTANAILNETPAPLTRYREQTPDLLSHTIRKMLAKNPDQRYQSIHEVKTNLAQMLEGSGRSSLVPTLPEERAPHEKRLRLWGGGALVLVALLLALYLWRDRLPSRAAPAQIQSVAVLPLENLSADPDQEHFADGMTEQLMIDLSKIGALSVISRTSIMPYKGTRKRLPQIAGELNVDALVTGTVLRSGNRVRITAQLVPGTTDKHLWANSYEGDLRDVLMLQGEVAKAIAGEIRVKVMPQEQARLDTRRQIDPEVHELYLKGRYYSRKSTEDGVKKGIQYFEEAIEKDPNFAQAYAGMSSDYIWLSSNYLAPHKSMPKAKEAASKALELDNTISEAYTSLGWVLLFYDWEFSSAEKTIKRAIDLNPSSAEARVLYSRYLTVTGRHAEALAETKRAQVLDPLSLAVLTRTQWTLMNARQYDQVIDVGYKAIEIEPNFGRAYAFMGVAHAEKGAFPEALAALLKATQLDKSSMPTAFLAHGYARSGKRREAEKTLEELKALARRRYVCPYELATTYIVLKDNDQAFEWFEKGMSERADCMVWANVEPWLDPIRPDPRFQNLLQRIGLPH